MGSLLTLPAGWLRGLDPGGDELLDGAAPEEPAGLADSDRVLLCHRSPRRRWYPGVWDLPGGHVEPGELPGAALARELREELGIDIAVPSGPPAQEVRADAFDMRIWLIDAWTGSPVNLAPDEHDAITWFTEDALGELPLAHDGYPALFSKVFAEHRA